MIRLYRKWAGPKEETGQTIPRGFPSASERKVLSLLLVTTNRQTDRQTCLSVFTDPRQLLS